MPRSPLNTFLLLSVLIVCVSCVNVLINVKDLPTDSVIEISGENPITVIIPSRNYTAPVALGCKIYSLKVSLDKPYYRGNTPARTDIQNIYFGYRARYRTLDNRCIGVGSDWSLYPYADGAESVCNCSMIFTVFHTGLGFIDNSTIPDEYYPLTISITPSFKNYKNEQYSYCTANTPSCSKQYCTCTTLGGNNFDENRFLYPPISTSTSTRSVSSARPISQNIYLIVLLIFFILYIQ
ncbi:predicted protein [Naegleria gruberi]|uniref:Predicted protein n=1 Tax=Naegleria gruberi TaxID=5762 RepID=D2VG30_NAEGR|nr:uncharacterized protein NAEGRDRAFT_67833 [Naegleria gruberi]EFC44195.1 predicted protein [Naegleria gruberi]|eukprot:XP_002676939.1 predicted protein [Naegleria gruberi strain NEG-M]